MEFEAIIQSISSVGFPIAMCLLLFWYIRDEQSKTREVIASLEKSIDGLKDIIQAFYNNKKGD